MRSLIIVPTYNEIDNISSLVTGILAVTPSTTEILIVDDNSPDGTGDLADSLSRQKPRVHVLHREQKEGLGRAYVAGFKWGLAKGFDVLVEMDADFSHNPKYLPRMLELIQQNDVVIGSRYVEDGGTLNWGLGRRLISKGGSFYARTILGAPIRDFTGGFNAWRREVLEKIEYQTLESAGYSFQIEIKYRAFSMGFKIKEFPIIFEDRVVGNSKMSKKIILEAFKRVWAFRMERSHNNQK